MTRLRWGFACLLATAVLAAVAGAREGRAGTGQLVDRPERQAGRADRAVSAGAPAPRALPAPASYDLSVESSVSLGVEGAVFQEGFSLLHTQNVSTALGLGAADSLTTGDFSTAIGFLALSNNTTGSGNTAIGDEALYMNVEGSYNTAVGRYALQYTVGYYDKDAERVLSANTAVGYAALQFNGMGIYNTAVGFEALHTITSGDHNTVLGTKAGRDLAVNASGNILIGSEGTAVDNGVLRIGRPTASSLGPALTAAYIHGIRGKSVDGDTDLPVLIDNTGKLGTLASSRRFKQDIEELGERSERLLELRPVSFHYRQDAEQAGTEGEAPIRYGLIAEEVAEIFPELVVYDDEGQPLTVKYHLLSALLIGELQREHQQGAARAARLEVLEQSLAALRRELVAERGAGP